MLVLTRKLMEKLYIGDDICVTVVRVEGGQVRLGVDAPRSVPVVRGELRARDNAVPRNEAPPALRASGVTEPVTPARSEARESDNRHRGRSR